MKFSTLTVCTECVVYDEYCSIEFDRDDDLFATAGVSRCIKVFDFSAVRWMTYYFYYYLGKLFIELDQNKEK